MNRGLNELGGKVCVVVGTRPGIIMLAPVVHELRRADRPHFLLHSGQHYSPAMDADLFRDLRLPPPDARLHGVADKTTHGSQTAAMLAGIEAALIERRPAAVIVGGDANTNLAAALAARKLDIILGHVEAGERSEDWSMPEEHNRRMIDHISDLLFTTNDKARDRLLSERVHGRVEVTGNPIVDAARGLAASVVGQSTVLADHGLEAGAYVVLTSHRQENVDNAEKLAGILRGAAGLASSTGMPVAFPVHPRTHKRIVTFGLEALATESAGIRLLEPLGYVDFARLLTDSVLVLTDSGGVQQEAYIHHRLCVTLRENTEWTETLAGGGNRLAGTDPTDIVDVSLAALRGAEPEWGSPFGDGKAAGRIVAAIAEAVQGH